MTAMVSSWKAVKSPISATLHKVNICAGPRGPLRALRGGLHDLLHEAWAFSAQIQGRRRLWAGEKLSSHVRVAASPSNPAGLLGQTWHSADEDSTPGLEWLGSRRNSSAEPACRAARWPKCCRATAPAFPPPAG